MSLNNKVSTIIDTKHINKLQNEILLDSKEKILNISKYYIKKENILIILIKILILIHQV